MKKWFLSICLLLVSSFVFAQDVYVPLDNLAGMLGEGVPKNDLGSYLNTMINVLIIVAAILAVLMIIVGGFKYITSELVTSKEDAKETIRSAIIGLILALSTIIVLEAINPNITKFNMGIRKPEIGFASNRIAAPDNSKLVNEQRAREVARDTGNTAQELMDESGLPLPVALPAGVAITIGDRITNGLGNIFGRRDTGNMTTTPQPRQSPQGQQFRDRSADFSNEAEGGREELPNSMGAITRGDHRWVDPALSKKMQQFDANMKEAGLPYAITEAPDRNGNTMSTRHVHPSQYNGQSIDINHRGSWDGGYSNNSHSPTNQEVSATINAALSSGLYPQYETTESHAERLINYGIPAEYIKTPGHITAPHYSIYLSKEVYENR